MRIHLIAVGTRMPDWVVQGYQDYARRLPRECTLQLVEIPVARRSKSQSAEQAQHEEGRRMLAALPKDCAVIALDVQGQPWSTPALADQLQQWLGSGRDVALLVGAWAWRRLGGVTGEVLGAAVELSELGFLFYAGLSLAG